MRLPNTKLTVVAICGLLQSVAWFVLALLGILVHDCSIIGSENPDPSSLFISRLSHYYIAGIGCRYSTFEENSAIFSLTHPDDVYIISWFNIVTNAIWVIASLFLIYEAQRPSKALRPFVLWCWVIIVALICLCDMGTTINFAVDYANTVDQLRQLSAIIQANATIELKAVEMLSFSGFMMSMSARGYILWLINIVFAVWVAYGALSEKDTEETTSLQRNFLTSLYHEPKDGSRGDLSAPWVVQSPVVGVSPRPPPWSNSPTAVHKADVRASALPPAPLVLPLPRPDPRPFKLAQPPAHRKRSAPIPEPDYDRESTLYRGSPSPPRSPARHASEALRRQPPPLDEPPRRSALKKVPTPSTPYSNGNPDFLRRPTNKTFF